jgi:DNA invertase Pin-like site-specific DNA recombinase
VIVDGYIRISQVNGRSGERFISPEVQREGIEAWAKLNGALVAEIHQEFDQSGGRPDRPLWLLAIERVEQGLTQGVVVWKLDRWGRSLVDGLGAIRRIQAAGGTFVAVQDGFDLSTDTGKLVSELLMSMAEYELDRVRSVWRTAQERAIRRGVHCGCTPPVGYRRREDGRLEIDPATAPYIGEAFRMRANRSPVPAISAYLEANGVLTGRGFEHWCYSTTHRMFSKRTYLGEVSSGDFVNRNAHEPLIDALTFQRCQVPHELPRPRAGRRPALLRGLLRCASCRGALDASCDRKPDGRLFRSYKCRGYSAAGACPRPALIAASLVEPYVEEVFWQELVHKRRGPTAGELRRAQEEAESAEQALGGYRDNPRVIQAIGAERFADGLQRRMRRLELALLQLEAAERRTRPFGLAPPEQLEAEWNRLEVLERRAALAEVIDCVFVRPGHYDVDNRVLVCLRGEAPLDLPRTGRPQPHRRPFDPAECTGRSPVQLRRWRLWSERRLREELGRFVQGREVWPTAEEFQVAGKMMLFEQMRRQGGWQRWTREFGIRLRPDRTMMPAWNDQRLKATLTEFMDGRTEWPTVSAFRKAGLYQARKAVNELGGAERWAEEFGLRYPAGRQGAIRCWTDETIERELRRVLQGCTTWPSRTELQDAGLGALETAVHGHGGARQWAKRIGFTEWLDPHGRPMRSQPYTPPT